MSSVKNFTIAVTPRHRNWRTSGPAGREVETRKLDASALLNARLAHAQQVAKLRQLNRTPWER